MTPVAKVSLDYDNTLSRPAVQAFARDLMAEGCEIWIVTMRFESRERMIRHYKDDSRPWSGNDDLLATAAALGIPPERIVFTNWRWKSRFLKGRDFVMHLDDCSHTLRDIRKNCPGLRAVNCWNNGRWKKACLDTIARWRERNRHG